MSNEGDEDFAIERGSGNVFADLGLPDAETLHLKAQIAAEIIRTLDERSLGVKGAAELTGMDASDFSRVRNARFGRLSIDRLLRMAERLGRKAEVRFSDAA